MKPKTLTLTLLALAFCATLGFAQTWNLQTIDNSGDAGKNSSICYDANGYPHIAYVTQRTKVMYTHWTGKGWYTEQVDDDTSMCWGQEDTLSVSIAISPNTGVIFVFYTDITDANNAFHWDDYSSIKYKYKTGSVWSTKNNIKAYEYSGYYPLAYFLSPKSAFIDANDYIYLTYYNKKDGDLFIWKKLTGQIPDTSTTLIDGSGDVGKYHSMSVESDGNIHVSYYDFTGQDLKYAFWDGIVWSSQIVDQTGAVGKWNSITVDALHKAHISYYDETNGNLKYAKMQ